MPNSRWHRRLNFARWPRGQALVEFALILPLILLLLVMAVDFGRVFFGWVAVTNMSRVGASYAALNADAWMAPGDLAKQAEYALQMTHDADSINCAFAGPFPAPVFTNVQGTADPHEVGDRASVELECQFSLITPFASNLFGGPIELRAESAFVIRSGMIAGAPIGPLVTPNPITPSPAPTCNVPLFIGTDISDAAASWSTAGFAGAIFKSPNNNSWSYIGAQSLPNGSAQPCATATITLTRGTPPATPTPVPTASPTPTPAPTPVAPCEVPSFIGDAKNTNALRDKWAAAGFVKNFLSVTSGRWTLVGSQNQTAGSMQICATTHIVVGP